MTAQIQAAIVPGWGHRRGRCLSDAERRSGLRHMGQATFTTTLTLGELEASFPVYCKALRILIREERPIEQIERSVCWRRLSALHQALPRQYRDPRQIYLQLKRSVAA